MCPLALRVFAGRRNRAMFAVTRNCNSACQNNLAALLLAEPQRATVDSRIRAHVPGRTAGYCVVPAVEFSGPLAMHGGTATINAINRDFNVVTGCFVNHCVVLSRSGWAL